MVALRGEVSATSVCMAISDRGKAHCFLLLLH